MRVLLSAILFMGTLSACNGQETYTWTQRMVVTVETPEGPVTGSTVYEITAAVFPQGGGLAGDVAARYRHRGEAAVVDLGQGRYIFALAQPSGDLLYIADPERFDGLNIGERSDWLPRALNDPAAIPLPERNYPDFVTFGDINDPLTADIFEAGEMAAVFGEGYAIASVTLEVVDAPMDVGRIEEVLPWLEAIWPNHLDGNRYRLGEAHPNFLPETTDANQLGVGSFSTEIIE